MVSFCAGMYSYSARAMQDVSSSPGRVSLFTSGRKAVRWDPEGSGDLYVYVFICIILYMLYIHMLKGDNPDKWHFGRLLLANKTCPCSYVRGEIKLYVHRFLLLWKIIWILVIIFIVVKFDVKLQSLCSYDWSVFIYFGWVFYRITEIVLFASEQHQFCSRPSSGHAIRLIEFYETFSGIR